MITLFNHIELWMYQSAWWDFSIDHSCASGCTVISIGFVGITFLRGECVSDQGWFVIGKKEDI